MKILVTGLCFEGNLGGPALALGLRDGILERVPDAELTFAVTSRSSDISAAKNYGCAAIGTPNEALLRRVKMPRIFYSAVTSLTGRCRALTERHEHYSRICADWKNALQSTDVVVNLSGIAFVGDQMRPAWVAKEELFPFRQSCLAQKPYSRFIQSYGPFEDPKVADYAAEELKTLESIYARGQNTADACRELLPNASVDVYPDCAIRLKAAPESWFAEFRDQTLLPSDYVVVSPSAVIARSKGTTGLLGDRYVRFMKDLVGTLAQGNVNVVLLAHSTDHRPANCDLAVCRRINSLLSKEESQKVRLVETLLTASEAKSVIKNSRMAVVSRYHATVAALSTATPVITIGWNQKYEDILTLYGLGDSVIDARSADETALKNLLVRISRIEAKHEEVVDSLARHHEANQLRLDEAFDQLCAWLRRAVPEQSCLAAA